MSSWSVDFGEDNVTTLCHHPRNGLVPSWSNYSIGKYVRDSSNSTLNTGWNMFALTLEEGDNSTNRTIALSSGWNLIGYSSDNETLQQDAEFVNSTGTKKTWSEAVRENKVSKQFATFENTPSSKKYKYAPLQESNLNSKKGYWVYAKEAGNLTVKGSGGSYKNQSYKWSDLMFTNGTDEKNISDAKEAGWIPQSGILSKVYEFDTSMQNYVSIDPPFGSKVYSPWKGYLIWSNKDNIKLLRQN